MKNSLTHSLTRLLLLTVLTVASLTVYSQPVNQVFEEWVTADGTQNYFIKAAVETDADGFVYVAGATLNNAGNYDLLVSKYDAEGNVLWTDQYDGTGNGNDAATALVVDANGNVFVTGTTFTSSTDTLDVVTIGYDNNGTRDWLDVYAGADELADYGTCITVTSDAVYVGGSVTSATDGLDFLALRYRLTGTLDWDTQKDYNSLSDVCTQLSVGDADIYLAGATNTTGFDWDMVTMSFDMTTGTFGSDATASGGSVGFAHVRAMDRDLDGNIYLTGTVANMSTGYDIHTVKIDTLMNVLWDVDYSSSGNHDDEGNALAIDPSNGNVYVGGFKDVSGQGTDFVTLMYNSAGTLQWSAMWNDTADGGDTVKALVVDANGNVTVTGSAWNGSNLDYHTVQYDDTGTLLWERSFNDKYNFTDAPMDIALTSDNGVVVTGQSLNPDSTWSYVTVKYLAHEFILPVDSDSVSTSLRWLTNRDQLLDTDTNLVERVKYYSNQCYPNLYFMDDTLSYVFFQGVDTTNNDTLHRIDMTFNGANAAQKLLPMDKESYWNNYYLGHIPEGRPFVSLHDRLVKQDVWPNIDVVYSSNQRGLKYYIVVHPGGETGAISLEYHGYDALSVDGNDALVIESSIGELVQPQALAYEMDANGELSVLGWQPEYLVSGGEVTFDEIGSWTGDLVIEVNWGYRSSDFGTFTEDVEWSTFFGYSQHHDQAFDITGDPFGNVYVVGSRSRGPSLPPHNGPGFPIPPPMIAGIEDAILYSFEADHEFRYLSYYGGNSTDRFTSVVYDESLQQLFAAGFTDSDDPISLPLSGSQNCYVEPTTYGTKGRAGQIARFYPDLGTLAWATVINACSTVYGNGIHDIAVDGQGNLYATGTTKATTTANCVAATSVAMPICDPNSGSSSDYYQPSLAGQSDAFILRFNSASELTWGTYFGGAGKDYGCSIAIDPFSRNLYLVGRTQSPRIGNPSCVAPTNGSFPLCDGNGYFQDDLHRADDGFIAKFNASAEVEWSTYFGGDEVDCITNVALHNSSQTTGNEKIIVCGYTGSNVYGANCTVPSNSGFPRCSTGTQFYQTPMGGNGDHFIAAFEPNTELYWSTIFGGGGDEYVQQGLEPNVLDFTPKISIDENEHIYLIGTTSSGSSNVAPSIDVLDNSALYFQSDHADDGLVISTDSYVMGFGIDGTQFYGSYFGGKGKVEATVLPTAMGPGDVGFGVYARANKVYVCGATFTEMPTTFPLQKFSNTAFFDGVHASLTQSAGFIAQIQTSPLAVGLQDEHSNASDAMVSIVPNPTQGAFEVIIRESNASNVDIEIFNTVGCLVASKLWEVQEMGHIVPFDILALPAGIYLCRVRLIPSEGYKSSNYIEEQTFRIVKL